ncbi:MAG: SEC-C domain-containing protein [Nanoarchaeota archaeon]
MRAGGGNKESTKWLSAQTMALLNFTCNKCNLGFEQEAGEVSFPTPTRISIEKGDDCSFKWALFSFVLDYTFLKTRSEELIEPQEAESITKTIPLEIINSFRERHIEMKKEIFPVISKKLESSTPKNLLIPTIKLGRNDLCWCGSGLKYKRCCL